MTTPQKERTKDEAKDKTPETQCSSEGNPGRMACPVCGGSLMEIRAKFQCTRCHRICETCCEGSRQ